MSQIINLYDESLKPQKDSWGLKAWGYTQVACMIAVSVMFIFSVSAWYQAKNSLVQAKKNHQEAFVQLEKTKEEYPSLEAIQILNTQVDEKIELLQELSSIISKLKTQQENDSLGFSNHMIGLAKYSSSGIQIQSLSIKSGGQDISISGLAMEPTVIFKTIRELNRSSAFKKQQFRVIQVNQEDKLTQFSLTSLPFSETDKELEENFESKKDEQVELEGDPNYQNELLSINGKEAKSK